MAETQLVLQTVVKGTESATRALNDVKGSLNGINKAAKSASDGTGTFSSKMSTLGKTLAPVGDGLKILGTTLLGIGTYGVKIAGDFEQTRVSFETMLGDGKKAGDLLQQLSTFAETTPFEFPEIARAGKSLLAFGVAAEDIQTNLRMLGDIAAGLNIPFNELSDIYGKIKVQGRLFAEDINQLTGRGIPVIGELAKQFGVTEAEVKKLVESGKVGFPEIEKAFQNLTGEGSKFGGMMEKQSQTLNGVMSTIKDQMKTTLMEVIGINKQGEIEAGSIFDNIKNKSLELSENMKLHQAEIQEGMRNTIAVVKLLGETVIFLTKSYYNLGSAMGYVTAQLVITHKKWLDIVTESGRATGEKFREIKENVTNVFNAIYDIATARFQGIIDLINKAISLANKIPTVNIDPIRSQSNSGSSSKPSSSGGKTTTFKKKAIGGTVTMGNEYWVGEEGPEKFIPSRSGQIIPNNKSISGGNNVSINISGTFGQGVAEEISNMIVKKLKIASYI